MSARETDVLRWISGGMAVGSIMAVNRLVMLVLTILLARTLGPAEFGVYAYTISMVTFLALFCELGFPIVVEREVASVGSSGGWRRVRGLIQMAVWVQLALGGVCVAIVFGTGFGHEQSLIVTVAVLMVPLLGLFRIACHLISGMHYIVWSRLIEYGVRPLMVVIGVASLYFLFDQPRVAQVAVVAQIITLILVVIFACHFVWRRLPHDFWKQAPVYDVTRWWRSAGTLTFSAAAVTINTQFDVVVLGLFRSSEEVGIYRTATQGASLAGLALLATGMYLTPILARLWAEKDSMRIQQIMDLAVRWVTAGAIVVSLLLGLWGHELLGLLFGQAFTAGYLPMVILIGGHVVAALLGAFNGLLNMTGNEAAGARAIAVGAFVNLVLNIALIPVYGMVGAATATLISALVWHGMLSWGIRKHVGIRPTVFGI